MSFREAARERWLGVASIMSDPAFELTIEEFVVIFQAFRALKHSGNYIDPGLNALMNVLMRQAFNSDEDSDNDGSDWGLI